MIEFKKLPRPKIVAICSNCGGDCSESSIWRGVELFYMYECNSCKFREWTTSLDRTKAHDNL